MTPASATTTAKGDATRKALLDAATKRFAGDGYRATSIADIARDAGVGHSTAFVHYANKEALFLASVDSDVSALFTEVMEGLDALAPSADFARDLFAIVFEAVDRHALARRLLAGLEPAATARTIEAETVTKLGLDIAARLEHEKAGGVLRPDVSALRLAEGIVALVIAGTMASVQTGDAYLARFGDGLTALFQSALTIDPRLA